MSIEWDWDRLLRTAIEQAKTEGVGRDELALTFESVLAETYSEET